ncbi:MAG: peptidoglycan DD-metalloendopeptidase family protein [Lachnospiraceae bacterium]|nr:peptidoglycan DD-metalloendopeptidase family protein [Lachnospiraceae bacterium]
MKRQSRYNRNHKSGMKKERIVMIASSAFVLAALTMTGVYVRNNSEKTKNDGYNIDFSVLEDSAGDKYEEIQNNAEQDFSNITVTEDDLDYTPMEQVDSGIVEIPGLTDNKPAVLEGPTDEKLAELENNITNMYNAEGSETDDAKKKAEEDAKDQAAMEADAGEKTDAEPVAGFAAGDRLVWPVSGNILIPFSMDKTVYFSTLQQYKYNPGLIISAAEGDAIAAAAAGKVTDIFFDEEIGNAVAVNIGNGYEITYGQLKDIEVSEGSYVKKGGIIGYVEVPTKYYSVEGTNVYFALTLDGEPVDPMGQLQ